MSDYRRNWIAGGTFFFTLVTFERRPWLHEEWARMALRAAITSTRRLHPFEIDAWVLLPDHLHCIWTLPQLDRDYATRWRLIKMLVAKACREHLPERTLSASYRLRQERGLWQRRYWEHTIRDARDFAAHADYIHYNPVRHGLCATPADWCHSTFHRWVRAGRYPPDWGGLAAPPLGDDVGRE
ncbi:MAG: transposase [Thiohalobacteraceae bacterium]